MQYEEAREEFIQTWGNLATQWGINRTMAQIHAVLLLSPNAMTTDDVMEELQISRGNANMNIRALVDWALVQKIYVKGDRKEFFIAVKDTYTIARRIAKERQRRELSPVVSMLEVLKDIDGDGEMERELKTFSADMYEMTKQINSLLSAFGDSEPKWWKRKLIGFLK
jgi:DNA-binding transcriptional regulator GbsR (MarR family)